MSSAREELEADRPADYLERLAASEAGRAVKELVIAQLGIAPGDTVVDLGCGPGTDLAAFAAAVGPSGRVVGLDSDGGAVRRAAEVSTALAQVEVMVADVHGLDLGDGSVDRIHTDRVLQHVAAPERVVAEAARVLRPGGVAVFAEPDWDTFVVDHPDPATLSAYRRFVVERVVPNPWVGRQVAGLCDRRGLRVVRVLPVTAVYRDLVEADRVFGFRRVTQRALDAGYLSAHDAAAWLDHLRSAPLLVSVTLFVTVAERPPASPHTP